MFVIFLAACRKYKFTYSINANHGLTLHLYPDNMFGFFEVKQEYYARNYFMLFLEAIKKMKDYRKGCVY